MHRVLVLAAVFLAAVWGDEGDMKKCMRIIHPRSHHCCKGATPHNPLMHDESSMKECLQLQKPPSCDREICFATKLGVATSDGQINKDGLQKMIEDKFSDNPELLKLMKDNCLDGDISKFGPLDICDPLKMRICLGVQFAANCPEWDDEGDCAGMQELVKECNENFAV